MSWRGVGTAAGEPSAGLPIQYQAMLGVINLQVSGQAEGDVRLTPPAVHALGDIVMYTLVKLTERASSNVVMQRRSILRLVPSEEYVESGEELEWKIRFNGGSIDAENFSIVALRHYPQEEVLVLFDIGDEDEDEFKNVTGWMKVEEARRGGLSDIIDEFSRLKESEQRNIFNRWLNRVRSKSQDNCEEHQQDPDQLTYIHVQWAVRTVFRGELGKHAVSEGTKAVTKFRDNGTDRNFTSGLRGLFGHVSKGAGSKTTGLCAPVATIGLDMMRISGRSVAPSAAVFTSAVVEYIVAELIELAEVAAKDLGTDITCRCLNLAIRGETMRYEHVLWLIAHLSLCDTVSWATRIMIYLFIC